MAGSILLSGGNKKTRWGQAAALVKSYGFSPKKEHPDLFMLEREEGKKSIGIAEARKIGLFLREKPYAKKVKVAVVKEANLLTDEAQASLLKILEEPPDFALIVLLTDKEGSLLPTVVSRCQRTGLVPAAVSDGELNTYNLFELTNEERFALAAKLAQQDKADIVDFVEGVLGFDCKNANACKAGLPAKLETFLKDFSEANVAAKFALEYLFLLHKRPLC